MHGGKFKGHIEVKGMTPNSWYLVTLYSTDPETAKLLGVVGYYGRVPKYRVYDGWADIALFKTDAKGNEKINLPYTSPVIDPTFGKLTAPLLPPGSYTDVTVAVKYVGTGLTPDWGLVIAGGYSVGGTPDARDYNLYEMAPLSFTISGSLLLVSKDPTWNVIWTGAFGVLKYNPKGPTFNYALDGYRLKPNTAYSLIYYADPWPGNHPGALIASGSTDGDGDIHLAGSVELGMDLPHTSDANYPTGAKIWLVQSDQYNAATKSMTGWTPATYLFEYNLITFNDTDVP